MGRDTEAVASLFLLVACTARKLGRSWERGVVQGVAKDLKEDLQEVSGTSAPTFPLRLTLLPHAWQRP